MPLISPQLTGTWPVGIHVKRPDWWLYSPEYQKKGRGGGPRKKVTVQSEAWMHQQIGLEVQERVSAELHLMVDCCKCSVKPLKDGAGRLQLCREMGNLVSEDFWMLTQVLLDAWCVAVCCVACGAATLWMFYVFIMHKQFDSVKGRKAKWMLCRHNSSSSFCFFVS